MTPNQVRDRVHAINPDDPEAAHADEDAIRVDVLAAIAAGAPDPAGLAAAALETQRLNFPRYYA